MQMWLDQDFSLFEIRRIWALFCRNNEDDLIYWGHPSFSKKKGEREKTRQLKGREKKMGQEQALLDEFSQEIHHIGVNISKSLR